MYNYFRNKNILITGINGFIGLNLSKKLETLGACVYGISRSDSKKNILKANILNFSVIDKFIKEKKINICFHLAAESLVEHGQKDPYNTFKINTEGTLNILESARKNSLEKIIIASTSHVYGNNRIPYFEGYTPRPSRPYETSKTCVDLIAQSYADTFNLPVRIPRFVNLYGPGDLNFNRIIPRTVKSVINNQNPKMWGGDVIRDYLYIDDAIDAYLKLASKNIPKAEKNKIFNFGSGNALSVRELIEKIIFLSNKDLQIEKIKNERSLEIKVQYVSWKKANRYLNWSPRIDLDEGLKKTIDWYVNNLR